jgi:signal transduction histidine kinase
VVRKSLSWQLAIAMLLVALVPLAGVGYFTLDLLERSVVSQVLTDQAQLAQAAAAMVRQTIKDGQNRLKLIAARLAQSKNPEELARQLDRQMDPPGMLLEISVVVAKDNPEVLVQAQQAAYNQLLNDNLPVNRAFDPRLKQQVTQWNNSMGNIGVPLRGGEFAAETLEIVQDVCALPISVPAPQNRVLTATLDFRPLLAQLATLGAPNRNVTLLDASDKPISAGPPSALPPSELFHSAVPVGHARWSVEVSEPATTALASLHAVRARAFHSLWIAAALALALATFFARRIVRPVASLSNAAHRLAGGDLSARSGVSGQDEIGELARAFDRMAAAVQQLDTMKGDFVAHVSHELRTPLTSAKATLANVQEGISGPDALGRVQLDLDRLIRMVNELLDVARIEAGITLAKQPTDLGGLVRSAAESLRPLAKVALSVSGSGDTLDLDAARVQQIVVNLVDNALKYAKSRVDVEVKGREVRVSDDGPGVPPEQRERIFEKFARVESGPKPPGAGLGLSIARKLAQLHGGSLVCEGNTFVLRF